MNKNEILSEQLSLLRDEIKILNDRIQGVMSNVWKVRQISLTLWLATISIGLGAISKGNKPLFNVLILSIIIPMIFHFIDARLIRWYNIFKLRDSEIQKFLSDNEYFIPSNNKATIFTDSLTKEELIFPIYDIYCESTFGNNSYFIWRKKIVTCLLADTPLFYYGIQYIISTILIALEFKNIFSFEFWWLPICIVPILLVILSFNHNRKLKYFLNSMKSTYNNSLQTDRHSASDDL